MAREILGHIDCPSCGAAKGMRVTHDKNGEPFAFCEANCNQQLRIGGDKRRVRLFLERFPWAAGPDAIAANKPAALPVAPVPVAVPAPKKPAPEPAPVGVKKKSGNAFLDIMNGD